MKFRPFGYAINYDREIALDELALADAENVIARGWIVPDEIAAQGYAYNLSWHLIANEAAATAFGLSLEERLALAWTMEFSEAAIAAAGLPVRDPSLERWRRVGDEIAARVDKATAWASGLPTAAQAKAWRSKAKADLARHRRNREKFGR